MANSLLNLLKSNPITKKYKDIKKAFAGMIWGVVLVFGSFIVLAMSFTSVEKNSESIIDLDLQTAEEAIDNEGLVEVEGVITSDGVILTYDFCDDFDCFYPQDDPESLENLLYYEVSYQRYEVVKDTKSETVTTTVDGVETTETIEKDFFVEEWVEKDNAESWAYMEIGEITIEPADFDKYLDYKTDEVDNVYIENLKELNTLGQNVSSQVGDTRAVIKYVTNEGDFIIVGQLDDGVIKDGDVTIFTDMTEDELITQLSDEEDTQRLGFRILAWVMLSLGFFLLLAPMLEFVEMIPLFGNAAKTASIVISTIFAGLIILAGVLVIQYWYVIVIISVLMLVGGVLILRDVLSKNEDNEDFDRLSQQKEEKKVEKK